MKKELLLLLILFSVSTAIWSQNDSLETEYTFQTFNAPVIVSGQSVETNTKKNFNFEIYHRFGPTNQFFAGLDKKVNVRWGFTYGITDNYTVGFGRSKFSGTWDFYGKAKLLKQSTGGKSIPVTITAYSNFVMRTSTQGTEINGNGGNGGNSGENGGGNGGGGNGGGNGGGHGGGGNGGNGGGNGGNGGGGNGGGGNGGNGNGGNGGGRYVDLSGYDYAWNSQLLIARKFGDKFSIQLSPTMVYLFANSENVDKLHFGLGVGARYSLNWRWSLLGEYYYNFTEVQTKETVGKEKYWGLGVEINTAMHTFHITLGSSQHMNEDVFAVNNFSKTNENDSSMHLGFNIIIRNYF